MAVSGMMEESFSDSKTIKRSLMAPIYAGERGSGKGGHLWYMGNDFSLN